MIHDPTCEQSEILSNTRLDPNGRPLNIFLTLAHYPRLLKRLNVFAGAFQKGVLIPVDRELVILRVAATCGAEYEFEKHAPVAVRCGLGRGDVEVLRCGSVSSAWTTHQRSLIEFTDDLLDDDAVDDPVWDKVPFHQDIRAMLELTLLVGFYRMVGGLMNVTRVELEHTDSMTHDVRAPR